MKSLVIGCGRRPKKGAVNLDMEALPDVDVVHNLEVIPYPFADGEFEYIEAEDVLEHVDNLIGIMQELHRILAPGGTLWIRGPHALYPLQAWRDPTHKRLFVPGTFDNWDPSTRDGKMYGHYFGTGKFKVTREEEKNQGMEYWIVKV
jgi:predicted SAM-dependent methyltransferase